jgi:hypothetical protein
VGRLWVNARIAVRSLTQYLEQEMAKVAGKAPVSPVLFGEYAARYRWGQGTLQTGDTRNPHLKLTPRSTCGSANKKPDAKMVQLRGLPGEMNFRRGQTDKARPPSRTPRTVVAAVPAA